ncbi:DUF2384 domain-containing protein [Massilia forsythiae]|uniref:DUF2384 domain-containing protein n=2 Tax=Massilia forsythiae TaxID=2728020 RepID=A0A7Z2VV99_9BURK|nr:antitoxin Xre/MbcA/ParS toxin-binding domain-containing protein [Massilia forsythiae]QJD99833.1 DUF2384 domain-containing protein [Massilia forsythiae]
MSISIRLRKKEIYRILAKRHTHKRLMRRLRTGNAARALDEIGQILMRMFGGNLSIAQHWLNEPAIAFNGMRPLDLVAEGNIELLRDCLIRLEYGVYM